MTGTPWSTALRAALSTGPLIIAVTTAVLATFVAHWLALPGAILYAGAVYALGPARLKQAQKRFELGWDLKDAPPGLKRWNQQLNETLARIDSDLGQASGDNARLLRPIGDEVRALGNDIRALIRQAYVLHRYLNETNTILIAARADHLEAQLAATKDVYSRQQLQEATDALRRQIANCDQIRTLIGRTEATLENMQASLQSIGSSVVKLGAENVPNPDMAQQDSLQRLSSARSTVASLEEVLRKVELA